VTWLGVRCETTLSSASAYGRRSFPRSLSYASRNRRSQTCHHPATSDRRTHSADGQPLRPPQPVHVLTWCELSGPMYTAPRVWGWPSVAQALPYPGDRPVPAATSWWSHDRLRRTRPVPQSWFHPVWTPCCLSRWAASCAGSRPVGIGPGVPGDGLRCSWTCSSCRSARGRRSCRVQTADRIAGTQWPLRAGTSTTRRMGSRAYPLVSRSSSEVQTFGTVRGCLARIAATPVVVPAIQDFTGGTRCPPKPAAAPATTVGKPTTLKIMISGWSN